MWAVGRGGAGAGLMGGPRAGEEGCMGPRAGGMKRPPPPPQDAEGCLGGSWRLGGGGVLGVVVKGASLYSWVPRGHGGAK